MFAALSQFVVILLCAGDGKKWKEDEEGKCISASSCFGLWSCVFSFLCYAWPGNVLLCCLSTLAFFMILLYYAADLSLFTTCHYKYCWGAFSNLALKINASTNPALLVNSFLPIYDDKPTKWIQRIRLKIKSWIMAAIWQVMQHASCIM